MIMLIRSVFLIIVLAAGIYPQPIDRSINDGINKIEDGEQPANALIDQKLAAINELADTTDGNSETPTTTKVGPLSWFLTPLTQNIQFSPQSFLQDRIVQLKEALNNLSSNARDQANSKQFASANGLLHIVGVNDSGFYTNRNDPAGFFGGNGWLANKGGILGGPGAILSTGSLLTDYPSPYRKK